MKRDHGKPEWGRGERDRGKPEGERGERDHGNPEGERVEPTGSAAAAIAAARRVIGRPLGRVLPALSETLAAAVPHLAAAELSTHCSYAPFKTCGPEEITDRLTQADLAPLLASGVAGRPWQGTLSLAGAERPVLAVHSDATPRGAVLLLVREEGAAPAGAEALALVQALWDLVTAHFERLAAEAVPGVLARSLTAAGTRARVLAELGEEQAATLTGLLGVLRSRRLDDAVARATAVELAVAKLVELRARAERDQEVTEEPADRAFARLAESLEPLLRYGPVRLELAGPDGDARPLHADLAHTARAVVRAVLLTVLDQDGVGRVRVGWRLTGDELRATVRDDGPGELSARALAPGRVAERLAVLGGRLEVDAEPGWGTTVTAVLPLRAGHPEPAAADPLTGLGGRELEVLTRLALGHRNRAIAAELHISESTVKFHVANILTKLGVGSRGEAAAVYHAAA
ncbi:LuxR C-terminal-related transcriptional regulator [Streptomyces pyxinae]|uniref:LuxR C-terminal-related transcriptional regulator n=1 Tax=Streptomyces pyxinae TaxID=2970734 RepID=UPI0028681D1B|nr:LuxR C-terminal-related transcriptional regulator [Streptomyces sp. LP05-1]